MFRCLCSSGYVTLTEFGGGDHLCFGDSPECEPARELSRREFSLAPSNSSTESFIAVWKTANWPKTTEGQKEKHESVVPHGVRVAVPHRLRSPSSKWRSPNCGDTVM